MNGSFSAWLGTRRGSTVLVVVGIAGLIFGVLPVAAAVALAAGMAIKLCRLIAKFARRHRPAAAEALSG